MGRPINKRFLGNNEDSIDVSNYKRAGQSVRGDDTTYIKKQRSTNSFVLRNDEDGWEEIFTLVNKTSSDLQDNEFNIIATDTQDAQYPVVRLYNRKIKLGNSTAQVWTTANVDVIEPGEDAKTIVFALIGQSNMVGRPTFDNGEGYPAGTLQYNQSETLIPAAPPLDHVNEDAGDMGLALQFTIDYKAARPNDTVVLVPSAQGGTGFSGDDWNPGDTRYNDAVSRVNQLLSENPEFEFGGFLWHQGESDVSIPGTYQGLLETMITSIRSDVTAANDTTPFVLGGLLSGDAGRDAITALILDIPNQLSYTAVASSDSLTSFDALHFDAASLRTLGSRYYTTWQQAQLNVPADPTAPDQVTGLIVTPGDEQNILTWNAPNANGSPITDYVIEFSTNQVTYVAINDGVSTNTTFTHTSLTNDTEYSYRVSAVNAIGTGVTSDVNSGTPISTPSDYETGATLHYLFGSDNTDDSDLFGGNQLTPINNSPTRSAGFLTVADGFEQGLDTGRQEDAGSFTAIMTFRHQDNDESILMGTLETTNVDGDNGWAGFLTVGESLRMNIRGKENTTVATIPTNQFLFYAITYDNATGNATAYLGDSTTPITVVDNTGTRGVSNRTIVVGNGYYDTGNFSDAPDIAEFIYFDDVKSVGELDAIYANSVTRLGNRGVTVT